MFNYSALPLDTMDKIENKPNLPGKILHTDVEERPCFDWMCCSLILAVVNLSGVSLLSF